VLKLRQPVGVQPWPAAQVEHTAWLPTQQGLMHPGYMLVDARETPAGGVMRLREVFLEHALAETWLIPGYVIPLLPGFGRSQVG
jgi:hypothetical protein